MRQDYIVQSFKNSVELSVVSAVIGAVVGAVLAYAIATGNPNGVLRRMMTSACGVLAQFGGVTLAFAFLATIGPEGLVTDLPARPRHRHLRRTGSGSTTSRA